jgi:predicted dehydrogenase
MLDVLIPFIKRVNGIRIIHCVDIDINKARYAQSVTDAEHASDDISEINLQHVDAAIVALPPFPAYDVAMSLVKKGICCFIEKPAAPDTESMKELLKAAHSCNTFVQVGFNFRLAGAINRLKSEMVKSGSNTYSLSLSFLSKHPSSPQWGITNVPEAWIRHNGIHAIDLACWLLGDVVDTKMMMYHSCEGKFVFHVLLLHCNGSVSNLKIGNLTSRFDIRIELAMSDNTFFSIPNLGELIRFSSTDDKHTCDYLYLAKNLDSCWNRTGYGPELELFAKIVAGVLSNEHVALLDDALSAHELVDIIISSIPENS